MRSKSLYILVVCSDATLLNFAANEEQLKGVYKKVTTALIDNNVKKSSSKRVPHQKVEME